MKYPIHHKWAYRSIALIDGILKCCPIFLNKNKLRQPPKNILICQTAHLGDVILTTSLLAPLRSFFPQAKIGMLVGSWSQPLLKDQPDLQAIHLVDHWKINRSTHEKYRRYLNMRKTVLKELRACAYDLAIDCGLHFPNMAPLLWQAKIPTRVGFISAGFSPLLTHAIPWDFQENVSVVEAYVSLLESLSIPIDHSQFFPKIHIEKKKLSIQSYIVIHMGTGNAQKNWPEKHWKILSERLVAKGYYLKFTGIGKRENQAIERVTNGLSQTENLCDQLSWKGFTQTIQNAELLIAPDTSAGHVAAAAGTPSILLFTGINPDQQWRPFGNTTTCITHPVPCSPCFKGCHEMSCIRLLSVESVYEEVEKHFRRARPSEV